MSRPVAPLPGFMHNAPLSLRRPLTLEEMVEDCVDKLREDAKELPTWRVEIVLGPEAMLDLALRVMALEAVTAAHTRTLRDAEGAENE